MFTTPTARQQADAHALATDLGHLPLAIKQGGAYLAQSRGISLDAERTIARIWTATLRALEQANPLAVQLLHTATWLAPDDIPHTLLTPPGTVTDDIAEAIGALAAYSMITTTESTLSIHRLVQTVLRTPRTSDNPQRPRPLQGRDSAEQAVLHSLALPPSQESTTESQWDTLIPHLVTLTATAPPGHRDAPLIDAYNTTANRLHHQGHTARTIPLLEAVLAQWEQVLGDTHPDTLNSRNNLATARAVRQRNTAASATEYDRQRPSGAE